MTDRLIYTENSIYLLTRDTLTRFHGANPHEMRRDRESVTVLEVVKLEIGERAQFWVDLEVEGVLQTFRSTSTVLDIEEIE